VESSVAKTGRENASDTSEIVFEFSNLSRTLPRFFCVSSNNFPVLVLDSIIEGVGISFVRMIFSFSHNQALIRIGSWSALWLYNPPLSLSFQECITIP
jgi:hypothetical protein